MEIRQLTHFLAPDAVPCTQQAFCNSQIQKELAVWSQGSQSHFVSTSELLLDPVSCDWVLILALALASLFFTFQL